MPAVEREALRRFQADAKLQQSGLFFQTFDSAIIVVRALVAAINGSPGCASDGHLEGLPVPLLALAGAGLHTPLS